MPSVSHMPGRIIRKLSSYTNRLLGPVAEACMVAIAHEDSGSRAPVFIIGPPRSGSTLLMQVLTDAFDVAYLTNSHCRWFGAPALAEVVLRPLKRKRPSDYRSQHGQTAHITAPAECGQWWYRFFRRAPAYVTGNDVSRRKMRAFQRSIIAMRKAVGRALIYKNLYASLRIEPIVQYVPNALFVVVERDWLGNAQSILKGRHDALGSYDKWWSVPPPNVDELSSLPPVEQVVGQIESIYELINRDVNHLGIESQVFRTQYEDFCRDVHGTLERFSNFMARHGVELKRRFEVPENFEVDHSVKIPKVMYEELRALVRERQALAIEKRGSA